jgi:mRNA interferase YafQ
VKYQPVSTKQFKKDLRRLEKSGAKFQKLEAVIGLLADGKTLGAEYRDHELKGELAGIRECHIAPDWLLLYKRDEGELVLLLIRTGTHAKMFGE